MLMVIVVVGYHIQSMGAYERDQADDQASGRLSSSE